MDIGEVASYDSAANVIEFAGKSPICLTKLKGIEIPGTPTSTKTENGQDGLWIPLTVTNQQGEQHQEWLRMDPSDRKPGEEVWINHTKAGEELPAHGKYVSCAMAEMTFFQVIAKMKGVPMIYTDEISEAVVLTEAQKQESSRINEVIDENLSEIETSARGYKEVVSEIKKKDKKTAVYRLAFLLGLCSDIELETKHPHSGSSFKTGESGNIETNLEPLVSKLSAIKDLNNPEHKRDVFNDEAFLAPRGALSQLFRAKLVLDALPDGLEEEPLYVRLKEQVDNLIEVFNNLMQQAFNEKFPKVELLKPINGAEADFDLDGGEINYSCDFDDLSNFLPFRRKANILHKAADNAGDDSTLFITDIRGMGYNKEKKRFILLAEGFDPSSFTEDNRNFNI
ncbi:MAG: hypothetical protein ABII72_02455 [Parcubacteria group bacterium]